MTLPAPHDWPERNEDEWLAEMGQWAIDDLRKCTADNSAPNAARISARVRILADDSVSLGRTGPLCGPYFDRVTNRTLGKPREDPKVVINQQKVLNIGTENIFDSIEHFLTTEPALTRFRLEPREIVAGSDHEPADSQRAARERGGKAGDAESGGGEPVDPA